MLLRFITEDVSLLKRRLTYAHDSQLDTNPVHTIGL